MSSKPEAPAKDPKLRSALGPSLALQAFMGQLARLVASSAEAAKPPGQARWRLIWRRLDLALLLELLFSHALFDFLAHSPKFLRVILIHLNGRRLLLRTIAKKVLS
jgi:hypothetical protein